MSLVANIINKGWSELLIAADTSKKGWLDRLIAAGEDRDIRVWIEELVVQNINDISGTTTLLIAAIDKGYKKIAQYLIGKGANLNLEDRNGVTPLIAAIRKGNFEIIDCLLDGSNVGGGKIVKEITIADVNKEDGEGNLPLIEAIKKEDYKIIELLIKKGANIYKKDGKGITAIDMLEKIEDNELKEELIAMQKNKKRPISSIEEENIIDRLNKRRGFSK